MADRAGRESSAIWAIRLKPNASVKQMSNKRSNPPINRYAAIAVFSALIVYLVWGQLKNAQQAPPRTTAGDSQLIAAIRDRQSDAWVSGEGVVSRILPDDLDGSRHQRFILRLSTGDTVLVAHNIDLAPRVADLKVGATVEFQGEYEWNDSGGVIHWTHHDPAGAHPSGWLRYRGEKYE
jgi:hypothetical protein